MVFKKFWEPLTNHLYRSYEKWFLHRTKKNHIGIFDEIITTSNGHALAIQNKIKKSLQLEKLTQPRIKSVFEGEYNPIYVAKLAGLTKLRINLGTNQSYGVSTVCSGLYGVLIPINRSLPNWKWQNVSEVSIQRDHFPVMGSNRRGVRKISKTNNELSHNKVEVSAPFGYYRFFLCGNFSRTICVVKTNQHFKLHFVNNTTYCWVI